jgi:homoaconitase/3-isopropylmalate dehydratase large subunit
MFLPLTRRLFHGNRMSFFNMNVEVQNTSKIPKNLDTKFLAYVESDKPVNNAEEKEKWKSTRGDGKSIYDCENELWTIDRED